ncbi:unnamed protein product [Brassica oleracea var. botrytis]
MMHQPRLSFCAKPRVCTGPDLFQGSQIIHIYGAPPAETTKRLLHVVPVKPPNTQSKAEAKPPNVASKTETLF